jgi:DNA invertase Pin-like site-specific DNA recombinase
MKWVAVYIRVSTKERTEKGWSIEGQYKDIMEHCDKRKEWKVVSESIKIRVSQEKMSIGLDYKP